MTASKVYRLTNGRRVTVREVADELGLNRETARRRLVSSRDPAVVLAPPQTDWQVAPVHRLDDGTTGTAQELAALVPGITREGMAHRLRRYGSDSARVLEPKEASVGKAWRTTHRLNLPGTPEWR